MKSLVDENEDLKSKLGNAELQLREITVEKYHQEDVQKNNTSVAIRIQENKLGKLQEQLAEKTTSLGNTERWLKEANKRELKLVDEIEKLRNQDSYHAKEVDDLKIYFPRDLMVLT